MQVRIYFTTFEGKRWTAVENARNAVNRFHKENHWRAPPFWHPRLTDFWRGLRKQCNNTKGGQAAVGQNLIRKVVRQWSAQGTLDAVRNAFMATAQYWGVRRFDEVRQPTAGPGHVQPDTTSARTTHTSGSDTHGTTRQVRNLRRVHINKRKDGGYTLTVVKQKNDPNKVGQRVPLPATAHDGFKISRVFDAFLRATSTLDGSSSLSRTTSQGGRSWSSRTLTNSAWNRALRKAFEEAGVPAKHLRRLSSHSLRKGGYTALIRAGVPADCAQQLIGHKSPASAEPYRKHSATDLVAAARRI